MPFDVDTPALLLDRSRLQSNLSRMRSRAQRLGVRLRPHMKTAKSIDVARLLLEPGEGITVSTLAEAEYFARHGVSDILYAVGFEPGKARRASQLVAGGADLAVIVDSVEMAAWLAESQLALGVWLEIDTDGTRCGISPDDGRLVEAAARLGPALRGVMTHAGGAYACHGPDEITDAAARERAAVVAATRRLGDHGIPVAGLSIGSTPTATFAADLAGVTEMRPGVFMFQDLYQAGLGVCSIDAIAISVLTAVIGHRTGELVVDAGALALSLDRSTARQPVDWGFGALCSEAGEPIDGLYVRAVTQEHGIVAHRDGGLDVGAHPIGSRLRILPNHACITAAAHARYHVIDHDDVAEVWPRLTGW
jgi:D-serine deaminase-like pyridoxal phosphate-dependent protein